MHGTIDELARKALAPDESADGRRAAIPGDRHERRQLFYFCPEISDASTLKRVQQFIDHGYGVTVFGFHRARYNTSYAPAWPYVALGRTVDGRYWHRLRALLGALPAIARHRRLLKRAAIFYARNLDQLVLALLARLLALSAAPIVYEVLDVPPFLTRRGLGSCLLRWIERLCLRRIDLLVLSSPGFHRNYYDAIQAYRGDWFLLENKLHPSIADSGAGPGGLPAPSNRQRGAPWIVAYFGLIRGRETFDLMTRLAERLKDRVVFRFRGALTTVDARHFAATLKRLPNMEFGGPYLPHQDLEALYRDVDFAWALDLEHTDHNSRWLMPCRFYEAGYFGVPCLAVRGFEVGTTIERHRIGFTFDAPFEEQMARFFETLTEADYERIRRRLCAVPSDMFVARDDTARLCALLDGFMERKVRLPRD
jgi:succinoglycan biosynthesis protein ExoL